MANKKKQLDELYQRHNGLCWLCGDPVDRQDASNDHVIPQKFSKANERGVIRLAHKICNSFRGHDTEEKPIEYYREHRIRIEKKMKRKQKGPHLIHDDLGGAFMQ